MKRTVLLGLLLGVVIGAEVRAQVVEVSEQPQMVNYGLKCDEILTETNASLEIRVTYDVESTTLQMDVTPHPGYYDALWMPMGNYDRTDIKNHFVNTLHGKCKMSRVFKQQCAFGIGGNLSGENCRLLSNPDQTLLRDKITVRYLFQVEDPEKPFKVRIKAVVPLSELETASGRIKYNCAYLADPLELDMKVTLCRQPASVALFKDLNVFVRQTDSLYGTMVEMAKVGDDRRYNECKQNFEDGVKNSYGRFESRWQNVREFCPEIRELADQVTEILSYANSFDPCTQVETRALIVKTDAFAREVDSLFRQLTESAEQREGDICRKCQRYFVDTMRNRYSRLRSELGGVAPNCPEIRRLTGHIESQLAAVENVECKDAPCRLPESVLLFQSMAKLEIIADSLSEQLFTSVNKKNCNQFKDYKNKFESELRPLFDSLMYQMEGETDTCPEVRDIIRELEAIFAEVGEATCQPVYTGTALSDKKIAENIRYKTEGLRQFVQKIEIGSDVEKNRKRGQRIIKDTEEMLNGLSDKTKKSAQVKNAIENYKKTKKWFEETSSK